MASRRDQPGALATRPVADEVPSRLSEPGAALEARADGGGRALRALALVAVVAGLLVLTAAACVLSYAGIHALARQSGVTPSLARIYPVIFDALLVVAGCCVLALRGAGLPSRLYGWLCLLVLLAGLAAGSVVHSAGYAVPHRPAEVAAAIIPWALVLLGFLLLVAVARYARLRRAAKRPAAARVQAAEPSTPLAVAEVGSWPDEADPPAVDDWPPPLPSASSTERRGLFYAPPAELQLRGRVPSQPGPAYQETDHSHQAGSDFDLADTGFGQADPEFDQTDPEHAGPEHDLAQSDLAQSDLAELDLDRPDIDEPNPDQPADHGNGSPGSEVNGAGTPEPSDQPDEAPGDPPALQRPHGSPTPPEG